MLISWGVDELTSKQERVSSCRLIFGKIHYPFTPSLLRSLTPYYSIPYYLLTTLLLTTYYFTTYYLLLTTYYSTTLLLTTYYFLPYYSFLFQGITTFCYRQMG